MPQSFFDVSGQVSQFDSASGLGQIRTASGETYRFHCIEINDDSRSIAIGAQVTCDIWPILGGYEAINIATANK
ncbi:MAG: hypothetical protein EXQ63_03070 [Ilumatobacteraceae bacterium]|nr:hypothetical protein [Ilumatobacteraceae bacterium]